MNYNDSFDPIERAQRSIFWAFAAFGLVMVVGTVGYKSFGGDDVTWIDSLYMTFLMVATIGYGAGLEIFHQPNREFFTMAIAFSGIGIMTYFFSSVTALVLASDFDKSLRRRRMDKQLRKINGHFILCGFGRVGRNVAHELRATGRNYVVVDESQEILDTHIEKHPGMLFVVGDASDDDILIEANIRQARGVFAVTGDDSRNLMISLTAKQINPRARVVARCNDVRNTEKLRKAGADAIVSPNFTGGMRIASAMLRPQVVSFLDEMLRSENNLRIEEIPVAQGFRSCALGNIHQNRSDHYVLLAVRTGDQWVFNPSRDFIVHGGHVLIAMASPEGRLELEETLNRQLLG